MKGLANYVCKRRLGELLASDGAARIGSDRDLARLVEWAKETETGDRAELATLAEDAAAWRDVQSSSDTRIGAACEHFDACFVTRMRRDAEEASIVVVNHHLFFADLALRRGRGGDYASAIPPYDAVIFDEAHQIEDIATDFFGVRVSSARVEALVRDARRAFGRGAASRACSGRERRSRSSTESRAGACASSWRSGRGRTATPAKRGGSSSERDLEGDVRAAHEALDGTPRGALGVRRSPTIGTRR